MTTNLRFGSFELRPSSRQLLADGQEVELGTRAFDVLHGLIQRRERVVTKQELLDLAWPGLVVEENNLQVQISTLRKILGQNAIVTVQGLGYQFTLEVTPVVAAPLQNSTLPDQPSLAVLPFVNLSGDADQEYFADGVVDDIITALTQIRSFFVIARGSSFAYKGQAIDIKRMGRELGVRYLLEGGVRKAGDRLRITGQLVETEDGRNIWAGRFEGAMNDIFELQDKITEAVAVAVGPSVRLAEIRRAQRKPTTSLQAYDCVYRALAMTLRASTDEASAEALGYLRRAIELDPAYALAKAQAASEIGRRKIQGWSTPNEEKEGFGLAQEALRDHRDDPNVLSAAGHAIALLSQDIDTALAAVDRAVALNRNSMPVLARAAWVHTLAGNPNNAIEEFQHCIRLSPLDPEMDRTLRGLGCAYLMAEQYDAALSTLRRAVVENPNMIVVHRLIVICLVFMGRLQEAKAAARRLIELFPYSTVSSFFGSVAIRNRALMEQWGDALRVAGIPE